MKQWKVLATAVTFGKFHEEPKRRLEAIGCEVVTNRYGRPLTVEEFIAEGKDADAFIVGNDKVTAQIIAACPKLKVIAKHGIGVDGIDRRFAAERGISVTFAPGSNSEEVADFALAFMLMLGRNLYMEVKETKAGNWLKPAGVSMRGKTVGIVGTGRIGAAVARRAHGFGMRILGSDPVENVAIKELGGRYVVLDELLASSDFVTLHLPLTPESNQLLSAERIAQMKRGAALVNTARRQIVDYDALYAALKDGRLRGYATDVYEKEPPELLPMYALDNVLVTPHIGGTTMDSNRRMGDMAVDNVIAVLSGKEPPNPAR